MTAKETFYAHGRADNLSNNTRQLDLSDSTQPKNIATNDSFALGRGRVPEPAAGAAPRLLYLGFAFPPGVAALHPDCNPAGHALETQMVSELRKSYDVRSVGILPFEPGEVPAAQPGSGLRHELILVEKPPELTYRVRALHRLKAAYGDWAAGGWAPEAVLVYNLSPIYNQFLLWLRQQPACPKLALLLLDSSHLGRPVSWFKRLRHRCKPMSVPDEKMLVHFDACVGLSRAVERYFVPRNIPFLWMPGGCAPERACVEPNGFGRPGQGLRLGYFGSLGAHAGVKPLIEAFLAGNYTATLEICGYGKAATEFAELASHHERLRFHGLLSPAECLNFGRSCDLLINPRPASHGNENNFASKLFEYALTGRAILTARLSGVEDVLGPEALYFDPHDFQHSLGERLAQALAMGRPELHRRGLAIQQQVLTHFSWEQQGARLARFLGRLCARRAAPAELPAALAA